MRLTSLTSRQVKAVALFVAIYVLLCVVLARVLPAEGASFEKALLRWLLGIPATLALWLFLDWFGEKALSLPFWSRMPSAARILLLVLLLGALFVLGIALDAWWHTKNAA
jgi:hypothetical protein